MKRGLGARATILILFAAFTAAPVSPALAGRTDPWRPAPSGGAGGAPERPAQRARPPALRFHVSVDAGTDRGPLSALWNPAVRTQGRGSQLTLADLPSNYALGKWGDDVRYGGALRTQVAYQAIEEPTNGISLDTYARVIEGVLAAGGIPVVTLYETPPSISSCPWDPNPESPCYGRPTFPPDGPSGYDAWEDLVYDTVTYFSVSGATVTNPILGLDQASSLGLEGLLYHIWHEPNTNAEALGGQPGPWNEPTQYWRGDRQEFFELYRRSVQAIERVERDFGVQLAVGGCDFQRTEPFIEEVRADDRTNWVVDFVSYCEETPSEITGAPPRLDFFSWNSRSNDPNHVVDGIVGDIAGTWDALLETHGYAATKLLLTDWSSQKHVIDENAVGDPIEIEIDSHFLASYMPAFIAALDAQGRVDLQCQEAMQDYQVGGEGGYDLFQGQLGQGFTLSDVIKPAFNAAVMIRALHGQRVDLVHDRNEFIDGIATRDPATGGVSILLWYYIDPDLAGLDERNRILDEDLKSWVSHFPPIEVELRIDGLGYPLGSFERYLMDPSTSNSWSHRWEIRQALDRDISGGEINEWEGVRLERVRSGRVCDRGGLVFPLSPWSVTLIRIDPPLRETR